jgi:hypothetical protein
MKKKLLICLFIIGAIVICGLLVSLTVYSLKNYNGGLNKSNPSQNSDNGTNNNEQKPDNIVSTAKVDKSIGLKYWDQDMADMLNVHFKVASSYDLSKTKWQGQDAIKLSMGSDEMLFTISHMAIPQNFRTYLELNNQISNKVFYRTVLEDGTVQYSDNVIKTGSCPSAPTELTPPCGTAVFNQLQVVCSNINSAEKCDEVMKYISIEDLT